MLLKFSVDIEPVPQARPRFYVRRHGDKHFAGAYETAKCKSYKEIIAWHAKLKAKESGLKAPLRDPIAISIVFRKGENEKEIYHTKKPDIDNLAKSVKDALRGIIYTDDSQIVEAHLYKQYGKPEVKIEIKSLLQKKKRLRPLCERIRGKIKGF
jgi:Holliday junction resolvase RusA-like endonuclease